MTEGQTIEAFATLSLEGSGLTRVPKVREAYWEEGYLARFDATTLWLDAVWCGGKVTLICPLLSNLTRAVAGARFALDGVAVRPRFRHFRRHSLVELPWRGRSAAGRSGRSGRSGPYVPGQGPAVVSVEIGDWRGESPVQDAAADGAALAGRNVLVTLSKDNDLAWIEDWAKFHRVHHGADAALVVDNGSDLVDPEGIAPALRRAGMEVCVVAQTPLTYGPRGKKPFSNTELFLQSAVLNALRLRFLGQARAVLSCDIDELVMSRGATIFDKAVSHPLGYARFDGFWVHPAPGTVGWCGHAQHLYREEAPRPCPPKWCLRPQGLLAGWQWNPHGLERFPLPRALGTKTAWFYHFRGVNTGWKLAKRARSREGTVLDPEIGAAMQAAGVLAREADGSEAEGFETGGLETGGQGAGGSGQRDA